MLNILQILVSISLISVILMQSQGAGLGSAWGGDGKTHTRRGGEKVLFRATIVLLVLFLCLALAPIVGLA